MHYTVLILYYLRTVAHEYVHITERVLVQLEPYVFLGSYVFLRFGFGSGSVRFASQ